MTIKQKQLIKQLIKILKEHYAHDTSGHDWYHLERVWKMAKLLARNEQINQFVLEMAALLHDVDDSKIKKDGEAEFERTEKILHQMDIDTETQAQIYVVIRSISFKGGFNTAERTPEGNIVQDADRLEAIGAIGIARTFAFNGSKGNLLYDPTIKPIKHTSFSSYKKHNSPAINHFYEKLLLLKYKLNTPQAKRIAAKRHAFMQTFLKEFFREMKEIEATG